MTRPRHWAAGIIAGRLTLQDVPEKFREFTQRHVDARAAIISSWGRWAAAGRDQMERRARLEQAPRQLRQDVEREARRLWGQGQH